ncbi:MAG TPA: hypothetical protein VLD38_03765 [Nitrosopumilaceae archaeon]|nr:hypothetical protein [Nitrosopumilaceae archaeon]
MASKEVVMNQFCPRCNTEMEEFKTNIVITMGMLSHKRAYAKVCDVCGGVEFQMKVDS